MNTIKQLEVEYLRSSRTIEKIEISNNLKKSICFIYNYDGFHFRLFENEVELNSFFKQGREPKFVFGSDEALDDFLLYQFREFK